MGGVHGSAGGVKVPRVGLFGDAGFPFVDRLVEGEGLSYPFKRVCIMREERDG